MASMEFLIVPIYNKSGGRIKILWITCRTSEGNKLAFEKKLTLIGPYWNSGLRKVFPNQDSVVIDDAMQDLTGTLEKVSGERSIVIEWPSEPAAGN